MIYEQLKKHKFDFHFKPIESGFTHKSLVNEPDFWVLKTAKEFKHRHYVDLFDESFYGLFFKFVYRLDDNTDYRINLHCVDTKCRYLVVYIEHEVLALYDFRTPDEIEILGTECSFVKANDVLFNFELQYPFIMKDVNEIIREIQKKHP